MFQYLIISCPELKKVTKNKELINIFQGFQKGAEGFLIWVVQTSQMCICDEYSFHILGCGRWVVVKVFPTSYFLLPTSIFNAFNAAFLITFIGASIPVQSLKLLAPWWTSIPNPPCVVNPIFFAFLSKRVSKGL